VPSDTYPSFTSSPFVDFEPYQSIVIGLIQDNLVREDVWEDGTAEANLAYVEELIAYLIAMPQQS